MGGEEFLVSACLFLLKIGIIHVDVVLLALFFRAWTWRGVDNRVVGLVAQSVRLLACN